MSRLLSTKDINFIKTLLENDSKKIDFGKDMAEAEAKAWKTIWSAGHGVSSINDNPSVKDLVTKLKVDFIDSLKSNQSNLDYLNNQF